MCKAVVGASSNPLAYQPCNLGDRVTASKSSWRLLLPVTLMVSYSYLPLKEELLKRDQDPVHRVGFAASLCESLWISK